MTTSPTKKNNKNYGLWKWGIAWNVINMMWNPRNFIKLEMKNDNGTITILNYLHIEMMEMLIDIHHAIVDYTKENCIPLFNKNFNVLHTLEFLKDYSPLFDDNN